MIKSLTVILEDFKIHGGHLANLIFSDLFLPFQNTSFQGPSRLRRSARGEHYKRISPHLSVNIRENINKFSCKPFFFVFNIPLVHFLISFPESTFNSK